MIKVFGQQNSYFPISKIRGGIYNICWDYEMLKDPIYDEVSEAQVDENTGEVIERNIIGYTNTNNGLWMTESLYYKPTIADIKNIILNWYNKQVDYKILNGFTWKGMKIWLSSENQFNYKAAYDLAVQTNGGTLPITFKFGTVDNPIYYTFETLEDLSDFYISAINHINNTLQWGWQKKDSIDWSQYELTEA